MSQARYHYCAVCGGPLEKRPSTTYVHPECQVGKLADPPERSWPPRLETK